MATSLRRATDAGQARTGSLWTNGVPAPACGRSMARDHRARPAALRWAHDPPHRGLLRPRQDDHRQVEHAGLQPRVPGGRAHLATRDAALGLRPVRLLHRRRRPRPDGQDARRSCRSCAPAGTSPTVREIVAETLTTSSSRSSTTRPCALIEEHRAAGRDIVIVSASGAEVVEPIGEMLGADRVVATRMEIVDGKYTGEIDYYAYAEEKARAIERPGRRRRLRPRRVLRLQRLGHRRAHARGRRPPVRGQPRPRAAPDRDRRRAGRCCAFARPVALRRRVPLPPRPARRSPPSPSAARRAGWVVWAGWSAGATSRRTDCDPATIAT